MAAPMDSCRRKYLFQFANDHLEFRIPELKAIASIFDISLNITEEGYNKQNPFLVVELNSEEDVKKLTGRSVLIRSVFELWCQGTSINELFENMRHIPHDLLAPNLKEGLTYRFKVEAFNKKIKQKEKLERIKRLPDEILDFKGTVSLENPDVSCYFLEYYGPVGTLQPEEPLAAYFGKWIADGQRDMVGQYHLTKRHFIGNTSMDAQLSLIMANLGKVQSNMVVFDPFVGTGSLLVAAGHFGAYVMGTDIDYLIIHAKGRPSRHNQKSRAPDESIRANLKQYGREHLYLDALVADTSRQDLWRQEAIFDAIITDPPYGIREGAKRIGAEGDIVIEDDVKDRHYPHRLDYNLSDIFIDLLNFAARYLRNHGNLVYWLPVHRQEYTEENIPSHPCLRLVSNCEQTLNTKVSRRLITMEKVKDFQVSESRAQVKVDHFEDSSFRQKYFRDESKVKPGQEIFTETVIQDSANKLQSLNVHENNT